MSEQKYISGDPLYRVFHENSTNNDFSIDLENIPDGWTEIEYKTYPNAKTIDLKSASSKTQIDTDDFDSAPLYNTPLGESIQNRRSEFPKTESSISKDQVGTILQYGVGITEKGTTDDANRRAYPSAGARYPIETYITVLSGSDINEALYHYNILNNTLETIYREVDDNSLSFIQNDYTVNATAVLFLTARFEQSTKKYGDRGYRYTLIESGHAAQNICLVAESMDISCRPVGGFIDHKADSFLNLQGGESTIYALILGE